MVIKCQAGKFCLARQKGFGLMLLDKAADSIGKHNHAATHLNLRNV